MLAEPSQDELNVPQDIPPTGPKADYYFGLGVGPHNAPALEAVKTWIDGDERRFDTFTIAEYGMYDQATVEERELTEMQNLWGVQSAMNLAEKMAVAGGYLDADREDGRVFFVKDAPPDPFTTVRGRALEQARELPDYAVDAISANGRSHLDVIKTWGEEEHANLIIPQPRWEVALANAQAAHDMMLDGDLQGAMTLVELAGVEAGVIDPQRSDARLFTEGPPDPFMTIRERELAVPDFDMPLQESVALGSEYVQWAAEREGERQANATLEGAEWFEATFNDNPEIDLLQPIGDTVNYAIVVTDTDPWTTELMIDKFWREPGGYVGSDSLIVDSYDSDDEIQREVADAARKTLLGIYEARGLEGMMWTAELGAMENGHLDGDRTDTRLFREGPPDRFETLAHRLQSEPNPFSGIGDDRVDDETQELPAITPESEYLLNEADIAQPESASRSWDDLVAAQMDDEPAPEAHYWQMHYRPVETPEGEKLGTALFVTEFPQLPPDFDAYIDEWGMDDTIYPTEARTVEMAHFADEKDAAKFDAEFRAYLVPGVLDAPELAPEVAKLEGLSGEWEDMDYEDIVGYMSGDWTVVREGSEWHLHNPNAERDAQIAHLETDTSLSHDAYAHGNSGSESLTANLEI